MVNVLTIQAEPAPAARSARSSRTAASNNRLDEGNRKGFADVQCLCDDTVIAIEKIPLSP